MRHAGRLFSILLSVVVLAAACGDADTSGDTTTTVIAGGDTTTTTVSQTDTTLAGTDTTTTTTGGTDTTTVATTTTTTVAGSPTTTTPAETPLLTVSDPRGFSFGYPASWTMEQDTFGDYLMSSPFTSGSDLFAESFEIYADPFWDGTADEYGELWLEALGLVHDDLVVIAEESADIGGLTGYILEYQIPGGDTHTREGYVMFDGVLYNVYYTGTIDEYPVWLADGMRIWDSFSFSG
ncbi:MAG: hypothetical protein HKN01_12160 [Acidimicrobiia bacterium]|nr:hypothetical protein [Acidimicrobiia bacterium]NNK92631.1 hypothetical protein [Acidimicrobiia bacterium]